MPAPVGDDQRIFILGHTGTGKSHEGIAQLALRSIDQMPWICYDVKGNDLLAMVPVSAPASIEEPPPTDPGLYVVKIGWQDCEANGRLSRHLLSVLEQGNTGVFIDEGQMLGHHNIGLKSLIIQGRSQRVPLIFVAQRPVHVDTFIFSEADFIQFFLLYHPDDKERLEKQIPPDRFDWTTLVDAPDHCSLFYDQRRATVEFVPPAPPFDQLQAHILARLPVYYDPEPEGGTLPERRIKV